jgi:hypothetical protein
VAATVVMEACAQAGSTRRCQTWDAALEAFKQWWELFHVIWDHAEELIEPLRQHIVFECLVDEATGFPSSTAAAPDIKPISVVRLKQISKAISWLVIEL